MRLQLQRTMGQAVHLTINFVSWPLLCHDRKQNAPTPERAHLPLGASWDLIGPGRDNSLQ